MGHYNFGGKPNATPFGMAARGERITIPERKLESIDRKDGKNDNKLDKAKVKKALVAKKMSNAPKRTGISDNDPSVRRAAIKGARESRSTKDWTSNSYIER